MTDKITDAIKYFCELFQPKGKLANTVREREMNCIALEALREYAERQNNPPLTEEQIRGRLDKSIPTWVENIDHKDDNLTFSGWAELSQPSCYKDSFCVWWFGSDVEDYLKWDNLGVTFNLFAHEPKQEARPC